MGSTSNRGPLHTHTHQKKNIASSFPLYLLTKGKILLKISAVQSASEYHQKNKLTCLIIVG